MNANSEKRADIGLIGLAVMGQNLVLNMNDHGYTVAVYKRTVSKIDEFLSGPARGTRVVGARSLEELAACLKPPRKIMLMVKAGKAVDEFIDLLLPHLERGDLIIDGGNSHSLDTLRRAEWLRDKGLLFIGTGISGGEKKYGVTSRLRIYMDRPMGVYAFMHIRGCASFGWQPRSQSISN